MRDERLNDLLQLRAEPRRRVDWAFVETIYAPSLPYSRLLGGAEPTVAGLGRDQLAAVHGALLDPRRAALVVGGDLTGLDVPRLAEETLGEFATRVPAVARPRDRAAEVEAPVGDLRSSTGGWFGCSIGRARCSRRSESDTSACRGGSRTSTPCR